MRTAAVLLLLTALFGLPSRPARASDRWFTTSDGVRLHYIEQGHGHTIVFVPGWTMPAWIWDAQIAAFSRHYHVIAFDPRGQGESAVSRDGYDPQRRGEDIADLLRVLGPTPVVLVGWSLGVLDSLAYVHLHGDARIAGLVLVDNSVGEDPPPTASRHHGRPPHLYSREARMRWFVRGMFVRPVSASYIDRLTESCLHTPEGAAEELLNYPVPRTFWKEAVYATARPVLYLVRPHLAGQAENLRRHDPYAESVVLHGVGHAMFVDDPARFDRLVGEFIQRRVWP